MSIQRSFSQIVLLISAALLCAVGCEDLLPEYQLPINVFTSSSRVDTFMVHYYETEKWFEELQGPLIDYNRYVPQYGFYYSVINRSDETIETNADLTGSIELWQESNPKNRRTLTITQSDIYSTEVYNPLTNMITIDPGKALVIRKFWDYKMDDNRWIHQSGLEITGQEGLDHLKELHYYRPTLFHVRGYLAFNRSMPAVVGDTTFVLKLIGHYQGNP